MNPDKSNSLPDFSGVFDIDSATLPKELIEKDPDASKRNLGFLSESTSEESAEKQAENKQEIKKKRANHLKNRTIIVLTVIIALFVSAAAINILVRESKKPVISPERPVIQTISRYTLNTGVSIAAGNTFKLYFIDNDYDVHYIENGQRVEMTAEDGTLYTGTVTDIREASPQSNYIKDYAMLLTGVTPSTSVYAVFVTPDTDTAFTKEGLIYTTKTLTKTATDALTVPADAVYIDGNQPYVWLYSPIRKTLSRQDVKTGLTVDGITQIISGIEKSDRVAAQISCDESSLYDGIKVKVK